MLRSPLRALLTSPRTRAFHTTPTLLKKAKLEAPTEKPKRVPVPKYTPTPKAIRGSKIKLPAARLLDPATGELGPLTPLPELLATYTTPRQTSSASSSSHTSSTSNDTSESTAEDPSTPLLELEQVSTNPPIVKLIDLKAQRAQTLTLRHRASARPTPVTDKELHLSWSMAPADLAHKLSRTRAELLEKDSACRLTVAVLTKKGQRPPLRAEMREFLSEVLDALGVDPANSSVVGPSPNDNWHASANPDPTPIATGSPSATVLAAGGRVTEWKPAEFARATATLFLQSKASPSASTKLPSKEQLRESVPKSVVGKEERRAKEERNRLLREKERLKAEEDLVKATKDLWGV
ncbi:hypothetical protein D9611_002861 [Ephemerocybe angulata]|uniref:Uncharacterized protein n=1 Tax=Ephemerocybe angulata TaxID=980116 RepID=A0A8H5FHE2_9AGAR|nr:hypothetical protein D9611_002861 [Tulosesus angulatus]